MKRKLLGGVASIAAVALFALVPAVSQAGGTPHWYSDGKLIVGEKVVVKTGGTLTFHLSQLNVQITCKAKDSERIENPPAGPGTDEMLEFKLSGCSAGAGETSPCASKVEVIAKALPWLTYLEEPAPGRIRDWIEGVELEFRCKKGSVLGTATGALSPIVGESVLEFEGKKVLSSPFGPVTITGDDKLAGPPGDKKITAA